MQNYDAKSMAYSPMLCAVFCERGQPHNERKGLSRGLRAGVWLFDGKNIASQRNMGLCCFGAKRDERN